MHSNKTLSAKGKEILERYSAQSAESIALLIQELGGKPLDYSPSSLTVVWEHFLARLTTRNKTPEELSEIPEWTRETTPTVIFTEETKARIVRTAFYSGEVFSRQYPSLKWQVAKSGAYRDQVILVGFQHRVELCPLSLVEVQAWKAVRDQSNPGALLHLFRSWSAKVL